MPHPAHLGTAEPRPAVEEDTHSGAVEEGAHRQWESPAAHRQWEKGCQALYHYRESIVLITGALLMTRRRALSLSASVPNSLDELVLEARLRRRTILAVHVAHSINPAAALDLARGWHPS